VADDFDEEPYWWCDLNGTLCFHEKGTPVFNADGEFIIGKPINRMVRRIRRMLSEGLKVKIMSGSVGLGGEKAAVAETAIRKWCKEHLGRELEVSATITPRCLGLFNDKAIAVIRNTGRLRHEKD
jgi:hypothetical protein